MAFMPLFLRLHFIQKQFLASLPGSKPSFLRGDMQIDPTPDDKYGYKIINSCCFRVCERGEPHLCIGYFHHIPFPSYELFRILPERAEILQGLLGADFIAFHTPDYMRHFISAVNVYYVSTFNSMSVCFPIE